MKKTGFFGSILLVSVTLQVYAVGYKTTILSNPAYDNSYAAAIDSGRIAGNCYNSIPSPPPPGGYLTPPRTPMLWANSQSSPQPLSYGSYLGGFGNCINGDTIGGGVSFEQTSTPLVQILGSYASTWSVSTGTRTDLHPAEYAGSTIFGCWGNQQVGIGTKTIPNAPYSKNYAVLWNGSAADYVNLHPTGFDQSDAYAIWGNTQVGYGTTTTTNFPTHALMWQGSASSAVDLNPGSFVSSLAYDVWGNQQVGGASTLPGVEIIHGVTHAILWNGSAENYIDLNPAGYYASVAYAVCNQVQVGAGRKTSSTPNLEAMLWTGSAASVVNLHQLLPTEYISSYANDIDAFGNIIGTAMLADGTQRIVLWEPVPEPASAIIMAMGAVWMSAKRRR